MKRKILTSAIVAIMMGVSTSYGQEPDTLKSRVNLPKDSVDTKQVNEYPTDTISDYQQFKYDSESKFVENEKSIADLKTKQLNLSEKENEAYQKKVSDTDRKNKDLKKKLADYKKDDDNEKWESFKKEFKHDMDELGTDLKDFFSKDKEKR